MGELGHRTDEIGTLIKDVEGYAFRRDLGGRYRLELNRVAIEAAEMRVRIIGVLVGDGLVDVDAVALFRRQAGWYRDHADALAAHPNVLD